MAVTGPAVARSATGVLLAQGPPGPPGLQGPPGAAGPPGAPAPTVAGPPTRGLTLSLRANAGLSLVSGVVQVIRDQTPARVGLYTVYSGGGAGATTGTGINGQPTLEFADGTTDSYNYNLGGEQAWVQAMTYSESELSIAACFKYTGSHNADTTDVAHIPTIIGDTSGSDPSKTAGLSVGLDPLDSTKIKVVFWVNDSGGSSPPKFVASASVDKTLPHYAVATFKAGMLSLYLDSLAVVTTSGVGNMSLAATEAFFFMVGGNSVIASAYFNGSLLEVDTWNVGLTIEEVFAEQAWLFAEGGF